jgi:hypothetical protein
VEELLEKIRESRSWTRRSNQCLSSQNCRYCQRRNHITFENERRKNKTKLFVSISTGPDAYIQNGHEKYREASDWLEDFVKIINLEEDVRTQEKALNELISTKTKQQKAAERMIRELDSNRRQTELLTKRLEETKAEKEKILANQEQNKLDQKANEEAILIQAQKFEAAKKKVN